MKNKKLQVNRRFFLKGTAGVLAGMSAYSIVPNFVWAETEELNTLALLTYQVFPHPQIPEKYYKATAQGLLDKAGQNKDLKDILDNGVRTANIFFGKPFSSLTEDKKTLVMEKLGETEFTATVRGHAVVALYNDKGVWPYFGYPGSSFEEGGYIHRGVGDIFWTG